MNTVLKKDLYRVEEVADYFSVSVRTIYLWVAHKHLKIEKIKGIARISRESIINCRFNINESKPPDA